jgi:hypothetical protein
LRLVDFAAYMEEWNGGMMESWDPKAEKSYLIFLFLATHYSSIPSFQYSNWGEDPKFMIRAKYGIK